MPAVRAIAGALEVIIGEDHPRTVPAGQIVLEVGGHSSRSVRLDGRLARLSSHGLLAMDLTRSTGYHRLEVDGVTFWFGTEDAKLGLAGIEAMLEQLGPLGTGWTGQALFSDGSGLRDVHVAYGWLDAWADGAVRAVEAILASPRSIHRNSQALSRKGGRAILVPATMRLLRSDPHRYLSRNPDGPIRVGAERFDPLRVVARHRSTTLDTIANRRAVNLLSWLNRLIREVLSHNPDSGTTTRCRLWLNDVERLQRRPLAQALQSGPPPVTVGRQSEEATQREYRTTFDASADVRRHFGWSASIIPLPRFSYVDRSDVIYQAYAASRLAHALGLVQTDPILGRTALAFAGQQFDLYFDCIPPTDVLRSWRAASLRPDESRPDILLHERDTGRVALLDAKYRVHRDGNASEDSRKEVTAYLGLYGLKGITILYPGPRPEPVVVAGQGLSINEVPLIPSHPDLTAALPVILATLQYPVF